MIHKTSSPEHWPARQIDQRRSRSPSILISGAPLALSLTSQPESAAPAPAPAREFLLRSRSAREKISNYLRKL